jgi:hypothetical protein
MKARFALALMSGLATPAAALAGAWPEPQGQTLVINTLSYYQVAVQGYNQFGKPTGKGVYRQTEFAPYIEYGLTPTLTLGFQPRVQAISQSGLPNTGHSFGLVQANVLLRDTLYEDDTNVISLQGQIGVPGNATSGPPQLAQSNAEYEARLLYGHNLTLPGGLAGFIDIEPAYRFEENGSANQFRGDVTLGVKPDSDWLLLAQSFNTISNGHAQPGEADYNLYRLEVSAVRNLNQTVAVQFGAWHDAGGKNISLGNAGVVALWLRF